MTLTGFVTDLDGAALKGKRLTIPKGTFIKVIAVPIDAIIILNSRLIKAQGHVTQTDLENWKEQGGPLTSLMECTSHALAKDMEVYNASILNGNVAHKILFHATFGQDKALLFEEQGENYVLSNPMVAWPSEDGSQTYIVEANDLPELANGTIETTYKTFSFLKKKK